MGCLSGTPGSRVPRVMKAMEWGLPSVSNRGLVALGFSPLPDPCCSRCLRVESLNRRGRPERAFEEIFSEHLDALYRTALRLCRGNEADAEDLLQESALRAFTNFEQLRDPAAARAWLFTILGRTHLNRVRAAGRRTEATSTDLDERSFEAALAEWVPMRSPAEELERWQLAEQLAQALDQLPGELRAAVWLVDVEGFTQREAAGMQDVPEGTIASRLFRGRRQLRVALERPAREARLWRNQ